MDEQKRALLEGAGIDVAEAAGRFMNNEGLLLRFLLKFPQDGNFSLLRQALEGGDAAAAFTAAHTLKGTAGNLSIKPVYGAAARMSDALRGEDLAAAREMMPELSSAYQAAVEAIEAVK